VLSEYEKAQLRKWAGINSRFALAEDLEKK
jgi:hypothetical protein